MYFLSSTDDLWILCLVLWKIKKMRSSIKQPKKKMNLCRIPQIGLLNVNTTSNEAFFTENVYGELFLGRPPKICFTTKDRKDGFFYRRTHNFFFAINFFRRKQRFKRRFQKEFILKMEGFFYRITQERCPFL